MEKNQTSCPKAVCEKIFKAFTLGPAFSTIRRISSRQQTPSPAKHARNPPLTKLIISPQRPKPSSAQVSEVPIKFDYTTRLPTSGQQPLACRMAQQANAPKPSTDMVQSTVPGNGQLQGSAHSKSKSKAAKNKVGQIQVQVEQHDQAKKEEGKKPITQQYDDTFSAYIHQTKKRIMSHDQDYGHDENSPKVVKDHRFSDFIDQTKRKIRTTSSIKDRSESFFK